MNRTTAEEIGRLRTAEIAAERRYCEAVKNSNLTGARIAAEQSHLNGQSARGGRIGLTCPN